MTDQQQHWTQKEFLTYLLLFAAHADIFFKEEEKVHILSKVEADTFEATYEEFSNDNGYVRIQKLMQHHHLNQHFSLEHIMQECQELFLADNQFHHMEKFTLDHMKRLLDKQTTI